MLVVGGGAREHTLVWKLAQSPKVSSIYVAPGNAGTAQLAHNLNISSTDIESLVIAVKENGIDLVVVGPEGPLADGIVNRFQDLGVPIFGPTKAAAQIEASKVFSKELMQKYKIPCARSVSFSAYNQAVKYVQQQQLPLVIKADGLAAGKGVIIANSIPQAQDALKIIMNDKAFGSAGDKIIIEECLSGREMSTFIFTDGTNITPLITACDYKPVFDGNQGPNTGGMGSYSPPHFYKPALANKIINTIMKPTVEAMYKEKRPYKGFLYG
ncbi:MAG: phosphoribosylamine--glycine ligase, partial [Dehalococcoidales bacterium]|nr:phosphoribosylamine--glycine ligase [Dehalococcoidales bacterium]